MKKVNAVSVLILLMILSGCYRLNDHVKTVFNFNKGWEFVKNIDTALKSDLFSKEDETIKWEHVSLPHTANIEPLVTIKKQWQGTCFYRKFFELDQSAFDKHIAIRFGAAMHEADVYLNGKHIYRHAGGYLPFSIDISDKVKPGIENCILIKLNNVDNPLIPPGKPIKELDFNYYSGLYRNADLVIKDKIHISDAVEVNSVGGGGIMVWYEKVSNESATVYIKTNVQNEFLKSTAYFLKYTIEDSKKNIVAQQKTPIFKIEGKSDKTTLQKIKLANPKLWSPSSPSLYHLFVQVYKENKLSDEEKLVIGIRTFTINPELGLLLNGQHTALVGTNRHQEYPYIGYALSDNAQYRDAWKIKLAGFNFVRCSHYPQSTAFLDACDELGIIVLNSIPGWQFFGNEEFQKNSIQNIRDLVHRDRNHPCIFLWEPSLNETDMSMGFMEQAHKIVHEELPYGNVYTCGWKDEVYDVFIPARQHSKPPDYWNNYHKNKPLLIAEYGDWEYFAQNAGFNQTEFKDLKLEERSSRQTRRCGQKRLAQQALNFQEAHNDNLKGKFLGDANWLMFDYNRGYAPDIESSGIMDIFRLPKQSFYFYQSQANPDLSADANFNRPMVYIANDWSDSAYKNVTVYSNCDEVELRLNNKIIGRQKPSTGKCSCNLVHPPFLFRIDGYEKGKLEATGYIGDKKVATEQKITPEKPFGLLLQLDESGKALQAGCNDLVFVYASIVDKNDTQITSDSSIVRFTIEGDGELIGQNPTKAEAGIASILLKAGENRGGIKIKASCPGINESSIEMDIK